MLSRTFYKFIMPNKYVARQKLKKKSISMSTVKCSFGIQVYANYYFQIQVTKDKILSNNILKRLTHKGPEYGLFILTLE